MIEGLGLTTETVYVIVIAACAFVSFTFGYFWGAFMSNNPGRVKLLNLIGGQLKFLNWYFQIAQVKIAPGNDRTYIANTLKPTFKALNGEYMIDENAIGRVDGVPTARYIKDDSRPTIEGLTRDDFNKPVIKQYHARLYEATILAAFALGKSTGLKKNKLVEYAIYGACIFSLGALAIAVYNSNQLNELKPMIQALGPAVKDLADKIAQALPQPPAPPSP